MLATDIPTGTGSLLAELLAYPDAAYAASLDEARRHLATAAPRAAEHLDKFAAAIIPLDESEHEELFTRTFDINPVGALEIGWHLFGEDYHRGALLARLRVELRRHEIPELTELPDHLTHVLVLLDRMAQGEAEEFAIACVLPALAKMLAGFEGKENPYEHLLRSIATALEDRFGTFSEARVGDDAVCGDRPPPTSDFRELLPILNDWHPDEV